MATELTLEGLLAAVARMSGAPGFRTDVSGAEVESELRKRGVRAEAWELAEAARRLKARRDIDFVTSGGTIETWAHFRAA